MAKNIMDEEVEAVLGKLMLENMRMNILNQSATVQLKAAQQEIKRLKDKYEPEPPKDERPVEERDEEILP